MSPVPWRTCFLVFAVALVFRLGIAVATDQIHQFPRREMVKTAMAFAEKGELADPYAVPSGPTAVVPPVYAIFLGLIFRVFGTGVAAEVVKCVLTSTVSALRCALLPWVAACLGLGMRTGTIAGLMSALYIGALATDVKGDWAEAYAATALVGLFLAALRIAGSSELDLRSAGRLGIWWGLALLMSPNLLAMLAAFVLVGALGFLRTSPLRYCQFVAVLGMVAALVISPWPIRNQIRLGRAIWAKGNFGIMLADSFHPGAGWGVYTNDDYIQETSPTRQPAEALKVKAMGEVAYDDARREPAIQWMRSNPGAVAHLIALRTFHFWFPQGVNAVHTVLEWGLTVAATIGLYRLYLQHRAGALLILAVWIFYPPVYYIMVWSSRYRYPINWTLLLAAAVAVSHAVSAMSGRRAAGPRGAQ